MIKGMAARTYIGGRDPVAPPNGRQAPVAPGMGDSFFNGRQVFFFARGLVANLKKKKHLGPVALWRATRDIFDIFQNGHIFLKFLFFKNIKKEKSTSFSWAGLGWAALRLVFVGGGVR